MGEVKKVTATADSRTIVDKLEEDIALGRIMPRERLIEEELGLRFGVNRHVVRQVLMDLETMGLVVRHKNKGAMVRDLLPEDVIGIYAVRDLLEGKAAELIPLPAPRAVVTRLKDLQQRHSKAASAGDLAGVFRLNIEFHKTFFAACGNSHLAEAIENFAMKAHIARSLSIGDPKMLQRVIQEHAGIVSCLQSADRAALVDLVKAHIIPSREAYLETYQRRFGGRIS